MHEQKLLATNPWQKTKKKSYSIRKRPKEKIIMYYVLGESADSGEFEIWEGLTAECTAK